jgi:ATP-dependent Clp protease ATP-binding subunit ClpA
MKELEENPQRTREDNLELNALKSKRARTKEEEIKFNIYADSYQKAKEAVAKAEAALYTSVPIVTAEHPRAVFNAQTGFSIKSPAETRERLKSLDDYLASQIFLQENARTALANAYRARERGVKDPSRPTVLLFGGGSGLGKTELVKALVRYHLGMENRPDLADQLTPVTISLSEFGDKSSVSKLIGAAPGLVGYDEPIPWHDDIRKDPRAIVLFDEGDKAHPVVLLTLMQAFEEGILKDSAQRPINLKDTIIVININGITAADIDPAKKDDPDHIFECTLKVQSESGGNLFTKAVLNRIDGIYIFEDLRNEDLVKILAKEMRKLNNDFRDQCVSVALDNATAEALISTFPNPSAGGRWPRKLIQTMLRPKVLQWIDQRDAELKPDETPTKCTLLVTLNDGQILLAPSE